MKAQGELVISGSVDVNLDRYYIEKIEDAKFANLNKLRGQPWEVAGVKMDLPLLKKALKVEKSRIESATFSTRRGLTPGILVVFESGAQAIFFGRMDLLTDEERKKLEKTKYDLHA